MVLTIFSTKIKINQDRRAQSHYKIQLLPHCLMHNSHFFLISNIFFISANQLNSVQPISQNRIQFYKVILYSFTSSPSPSLYNLLMISQLSPKSPLNNVHNIVWRQRKTELRYSILTPKTCFREAPWRSRKRNMPHQKKRARTKK